MENCGKPLTYMTNPPNMYGRGASLKVWDINFGKHRRSYSYRSNPVAKRSPMAHRSGRYHRRWWYNVITRPWGIQLGDLDGWMYIYIYPDIYIQPIYIYVYNPYNPVFLVLSRASFLRAIECNRISDAETLRRSGRSGTCMCIPVKKMGIVFIGTYMNFYELEHTNQNDPKWGFAMQVEHPQELRVSKPAGLKSHELSPLISRGKLPWVI